MDLPLNPRDGVILWQLKIKGLEYQQQIHNPYYDIGTVFVTLAVPDK